MKDQTILTHWNYIGDFWKSPWYCYRFTLPYKMRSVIKNKNGNLLRVKHVFSLFYIFCYLKLLKWYLQMVKIIPVFRHNVMYQTYYLAPSFRQLILGFWRRQLDFILIHSYDVKCLLSRTSWSISTKKKNNKYVQMQVHSFLIFYLSTCWPMNPCIENDTLILWYCSQIIVA